MAPFHTTLKKKEKKKRRTSQTFQGYLGHTPLATVIELFKGI